MAVNPDGIPLCFYCCAPVNKHLDDCAYTQRFRPRCPMCGVPSPAHLGNCPTLSQVGLLLQKIALLESELEDKDVYIGHLKDHIHQVRTGQIPLRRLEPMLIEKGSPEGEP